MSEQAPEIILASASPRRRELLQQIGVHCLVCPVPVDETPLSQERPEHYVRRVAAEKSALGRQLCREPLPVLGADTAVVLRDRILGKPENRQQALVMLNSLSGQKHHVYSAVSLRVRQQVHYSALNVTEVHFRELSEAQILRYWETGEPVDKAGAYAIQGLGGAFVENIQGSFSGVVGLPLYETTDLLKKAGIDIFE